MKKMKKKMRLFMLRHRTQRPDDKETPPTEPPAETKVVPPAPAETKVVPPAPAEDKPKLPTPPALPPVPVALPPTPPRPALAKAAPEKADSGYTVSKEGKVLRKQALRLWEGDIPQFIEPNENPDIHWRGGRIHLGLLCQCLRFFRHGVDKFDSEVQLRLAYNESTGEWCAVSFPQKVRRGALAVEEIKTTVLTPTQREQRDSATAQMYEQGFTLNGTIHSHCNASAFQSGTDEKDETNQPGVHITLGHVSQDEIEVHGRVTYRGVQYQIHWNEWLDGITGMPDDSDKFVLTLEKDLVNGYSYPEQWDDTLYEAPVVPLYTKIASPSYGAGWPDYANDYEHGYGFGYSSRYGSELGKKLREETFRKVDEKLDEKLDEKPSRKLNKKPDELEELDSSGYLADCEDMSETLEYLLPSRNQFDSPEEWISELCLALWKEAPRHNSEPYFDVREFDNKLEYEAIPFKDPFEFFRSKLAEEMIFLLTCRNSLDEFDNKVAASIAPFLTKTTQDLFEYILRETSVADLRIYGDIGVRPSTNELVIQTSQLSQLISTFLEEFLQGVGDGLFSGIVETLTLLSKEEQWIKTTPKDEQEEHLAVLWAMLQLVAHHTDLRIPGVVRPQNPASTPPPPPPPENPDDMEDPDES